jgi:hypothetical protein
MSDLLGGLTDGIDMARKASPYGIILVIALGIMRFGQTFLDWFLATLDLKGERRHSIETVLREELDAVRDEVRDIKVRCDRVCYSYDQMQKQVHQDAIAMKRRLKEVGINDPLMTYILDQQMRFPEIKWVTENPHPNESIGDFRLADG